MTTPRPAPEERLAALADRTRLRALALLRSGPACVGDLVAALGTPQPTVSRHLATLRRAGLVRVEARDRWRFYALAEPADALHAALLASVDAAVASDRALAREVARTERRRARGGCCPELTEEVAAAPSRRASS